MKYGQQSKNKQVSVHPSPAVSVHPSPATVFTHSPPKCTPIQQQPSPQPDPTAQRTPLKGEVS